MFSGIVEETAQVVAIEHDKDNIHITMKCSFVDELKIDQSVAHNGVCLTVVRKDGDTFTTTAMRETLERSNLGLLKPGSLVNLERSMMMNGRLDGHIVQGHVDQTAVCTSVEDANGSWYYTFEYPFDKEMAGQGYITVEKGLCQRCEPDRLQFEAEQFPGCDHSVYARQHQFLPDRKRDGCQS